jgi:hypothetical protein
MELKDLIMIRIVGIGSGTETIECIYKSRPIDYFLIVNCEAD